MISDYQVPEPILFNPMKHHLGYMRDFVCLRSESVRKIEDKDLIMELKHLGTSVMDVYSGDLSINTVYREVLDFLLEKKLSEKITFSEWTGIKINEFKIIPLSDGSEWTLKYHSNYNRFVHIFPARNSRYSFRVKSNTLKSAMLYCMKIGKDYITGDDLNSIRPILGLSPVRDAADTEAIVEMIELLRN